MSLKYRRQSVTKDKQQAVSLPLMSSMNWFLLPQMTEPLQERMEVWNMYHGLQFAKIINLLLMALNILRNSKLFGIIQMEILFTLTVVSARYLMDISDSVWCETMILQARININLIRWLTPLFRAANQKTAPTMVRLQIYSNKFITIREKLNYFFIRISGISLFCQWHFLLFPERKNHSD